MTLTPIQLQQQNDAIRSIKSAGGVNTSSAPGIGTDVSVGATTQPAGTADPLLIVLQQRADTLQKQLDQRKAELATQQAISPEQREVDKANALEKLSITINGPDGLLNAEAKASIALNDAKHTAALLHEKVKAATIAEADKETTYDEIQSTYRERRAASEDQLKKENAYASCVTVAGDPEISPPSINADLRWPSFVLGSGISTFILALMIWGEMRRPKLIVGVQPPAAAPLVNPPVRVIPWPQPHQLQGLNQAPANPQEMMV